MENEVEERRQFLMEGIVSNVRFGFSAPEAMIIDVIEQVEDEGWESDFPEHWIRKTISDEYKKRREESKTWPQPTQTERLRRAFDRMCAEKIIALHFAGYTQSDSLYDIAEIAAQLQAKGIAHRGHCFYHEQDLERVIGDDAGELLLGFYGCDERDQALALEIGHQIREILEAEGFEVAWTGDLSQRIAVKNFVWQLVYLNEQELDKWQDERVLELMK